MAKKNTTQKIVIVFLAFATAIAFSPFLIPPPQESAQPQPYPEPQNDLFLDSDDLSIEVEEVNLEDISDQEDENFDQ